MKIYIYRGQGVGNIRQAWFFCPGCECTHAFTLPNWKWNESVDRPTFEPSLLCDGSNPSRRCHSFVTDGKIQFLPDSFHKLAGQTVDIPDWEGFKAHED